jgi:nicotinic acid mononucleotide adenylyltransferase
VRQAADRKAIEEIHASGKQFVIAITGGGSTAIGKLLEVPGGSRSVLEAVVPYASAALEEFLGGKPDKFCTEPTSRAMAMAAWTRARKLAPHVNAGSLIGVGVTASLVSDMPKRGDHRIHVGMQSAQETRSISLKLEKGSRDRTAEEELASMLVLLAFSEVCGITDSDLHRQLEGSLHANEVLSRRAQRADSEWSRLLLGQKPLVITSTAIDAQADIVFPGAFNPLHQGHREMARIAEQRLNGQVAYEISILNVDKPALDFMEIQDRLEEITQRDPERQIILTSAATFREKAKVLPGVTFVVGVDTLERIADPKYYNDDPQQSEQAIREIAQNGCRFLVFGRSLDGIFCGLGNLELPAELTALCDEVSESEFREDVSSTEIRQS